MTEPRWDLDYAYGRQGEPIFDGFLRAMADGQLAVEVKRRRRLDPKLYVELEHDPGRRGRFVPSGLSTTQADYWVFVARDTGVHLCIPVGLLRRSVDVRLGRTAAETDGDNPTRGRLITLTSLLGFARREVAS